MISVLMAPRSGTTYVHELLAATGLPLAHERPNWLGVVGFPFDLVDRYGPEGALEQLSHRGGDDDEPRVHVLIWRRPARAIASMQDFFGTTHQAYFERHYGREQPFSRCWLTWNRAVAERAVTILRLEELDDPETGAYVRLCQGLGLTPKESLLPFFHPDHAKRLRPYDGGVADVDEEAFIKEAGLAT